MLKGPRQMGLDWWMESIITEEQKESRGSCLSPKETMSVGKISNPLTEPEPVLKAHTCPVFLTHWPPQQKTCYRHSFKNNKISSRYQQSQKLHQTIYLLHGERKAQNHWAGSKLASRSAPFLFILPSLNL